MLYPLQIKAYSPPCQLWKVSYDLSIVVYMEIDKIVIMGDNSSNDNT